MNKTKEIVGWILVAVSIVVISLFVYAHPDEYERFERDGRTVFINWEMEVTKIAHKEINRVEQKLRAKMTELEEKVAELEMVINDLAGELEDLDAGME